MQKGILAYTFSVLLFSNMVLADDESQREAERLLTNMQMKEMMVESIEKMVDLQMQQNPTLAPYKQVLLQFFEKHMSWESLKPEFVKIYADAFTAAELRDLNAFYATPTGQKTIRMMPSLMTQGAEIGMSRVQANSAELTEMIEAESKRLQKINEQ